jgi:LuxR family maltose regulon positive regulatory protein
MSLRDRPDPDTMVEAFGGSHRFVFDYLADEVLGGVDEELRAFLVQTSIAERFSVELCRALTGRDDAGSLLERAERANLFLVPLDPEWRWYRYHGLFADYLRSHLGEPERRALHERAADYFDGAGLASEAIGHALAANSVEKAVDLVERAARPAFEAGELSTLMGWLEALPAERVASSPELASLTAWTLFETGEVAAALDLARRHLATSGVRGAAEGRLLVLQALMATVTGPDAESLADEGLALIGEDELFRSRAHQAAGLARLARGEYGPAVEALRQGFAAALRARHPMAVLPAVNPLAHALDVAGHRDEAEAICRSILEGQTDPHGRVRPIAWSARVTLGIVRYEANDLAEARRELEAGFEAARRLGVGRPMLGWAVPYLALVRQATGSPEAALEALQVSGREAMSTGGPLPGLGAETEARILLMRGDVAAAARWADRASPEAPRGSPLLDVLRRSMDVTIARVRLAQGKLAEARVLLGQTREAQETAGAIAELISIGVLEAAVAEAAGQRAPALRALERSVRLAAPGGYIRRFVDDGGGRRPPPATGPKGGTHLRR